jgi:PAS domain S-box-containing protein
VAARQPDPPATPLPLPTTVVAGLLEAAPDALITVDRAGLIALINTQTEHLFGYARAELIGEPIELLIPDRLRAVHLEDRARYLEQPQVRPMGHRGLELVGRRKTGHEFPVEVSLSPVEADGQLWVMAAVRDVTERTRAERQIQLLQSVTRAISEAEDVDAALGAAVKLVCGATEWDFGQAWLPREDGRMEPGSHWYAAHPGLEVFRTASMTLAPLAPAALASRVLASDVLAARRAVWFPDVQHDPRFRRREAAVQAGLSSGLAVPVLAGNEPVAVLEFFEREARPEDARLLETVAAIAAEVGALIRRKRAEEQLKRTAEELARSNAELEQFAYVASHDLQEPLRMVASYTQLLRRRYRDRLDQDANEFIDYAVDGATRMQALINDLLAYSRVGTQGRALEPTETTAVLDQVLVDLGAAIKDAGAHVAHSALPTVRADGRQLAQVFQNLIGNAIKYRRADVPPRIEVRATPEGAMWRFEVQDNGIGIQADYEERIFQLFQRLHTRDEYPGTGIGLAICRKIVERHGGRISVDSSPGEGSTFAFTLPAVVPAQGRSLATDSR